MAGTMNRCKSIIVLWLVGIFPFSAQSRALIDVKSPPSRKGTTQQPTDSIASQIESRMTQKALWRLENNVLPNSKFSITGAQNIYVEDIDGKFISVVELSISIDSNSTAFGDYNSCASAEIQKSSEGLSRQKFLDATEMAINKAVTKIEGEIAGNKSASIALHTCIDSTITADNLVEIVERKPRSPSNELILIYKSIKHATKNLYSDTLSNTRAENEHIRSQIRGFNTNICQAYSDNRYITFSFACNPYLHDNWKTEMVITPMGGGSCYWRLTFDTQTGKFVSYDENASE